MTCSERYVALMLPVAAIYRPTFIDRGGPSAERALGLQPQAVPKSTGSRSSVCLCVAAFGISGFSRGLRNTPRKVADGSDAESTLPQEVLPFPVEAAKVVSRHMSMTDCSYVELPMEIGRRILDSDFFQQRLMHPLSSFEMGSDEDTHVLRVRDPALRVKAEEAQLNTDPDVELKPGLGWYELEWEGEPLFIMSYEMKRGAFEARRRGVSVFVHGRGRQAHLQKFCNLEDFKHDADDVKIETFIGRVTCGDFEWARWASTAGRGLETVLLPAAIKNALANDMNGFLSEGRLAFFRQHGIPYKRSYLFYGVPGTGKSSMIRALATRFGRRICILQPSGADWNDSLLQQAVQSAPRRAIIIFEDVDSLFSETRQNTAQSGVTFSGLLNVLDGMSCKDGSIFVLTTNFRERLDEALTREGRIDIQIPFDYIKPEEVTDMFLQFYPSKEDAPKAREFEAALRVALGEERYQTLTPAALQLYFVKQFDSSAEEAIQNVDVIVKLKDIRQPLPRRGFGLAGTSPESTLNTAELFRDL